MLIRKINGTLTHNVLQINTVKDMKNEIIKIAKDLEQGSIDLNTARNLLLGLFDVSGSLPSDELCRERGESFESKTYYNLGEGEYIGDFEIGAKWAVDYFLGNDR